MKKLTLLLAALSLIVGALLLSACAEPMSSETDDGLAAPPYAGPIRGHVYLNNQPVAVGINLGDSIHLIGPGSGYTTSDGQGYFSFGYHDYDLFMNYQIDVIYGNYSGSTSFSHHHSQGGITTWVTINLTEIND